MSMPEAKILSPSFSRKKLVLRATELPLAALARWPTSEPEILELNTTGTRRVATLRGLRRLTARSPARRPIACAPSRSDACSVDEKS